MLRLDNEDPLRPDGDVVDVAAVGQEEPVEDRPVGGQVGEFPGHHLLAARPLEEPMHERGQLPAVEREKRRGDGQDRHADAPRHDAAQRQPRAKPEEPAQRDHRLEHAAQTPAAGGVPGDAFHRGT